MYNYQQITELLLEKSYTWLITGVAGFIGSNLAEHLLKLNQKVIGLDNLYSGYITNIEDIKKNLTEQQVKNIEFYNLDINNKSQCNKVFNSNIDFVLHHAAVTSVPFSIVNPEICYQTNIDGFKNIIELSVVHKIKSFVYASSSAVYGDNHDNLKTEDNIGQHLSPYAISKYQNEQIALQYSNIYKLHTTGLRYFNIYGKRQDPNSQYSAVIPKWLAAMLNNNSIYINGDGSTTRDFCYIKDVIQANILACLNQNNKTKFNIFNIGTGEDITLNNLFQNILILLNQNNIGYTLNPEYRDFQTGDIKYSCPDITKALQQLNYQPEYNLKQGLAEIFDWYQKKI